ncbi:hypothetical protein PF004_g15526 [Phytophthora fragariae]|uniref:Uncharacterized protein n=1 Tax=Phytophthora fragariae TaxID=53985 RepID=A0A6G0NL45_9STRA|nr:hypothetical protein PF004_g15526 [Phytophthora fragariae]
MSQVALSSLILEAIGKAHRIDNHVVVEAPEYLCLDYDSREGTEYLP